MPISINKGEKEMEESKISNEDLANSEDRKGVVDRTLHKLISRKLLVFFITTGFFVANKVTEEYWIYIAILYIGSEALANIFRIVKTGK